MAPRKQPLSLFDLSIRVTLQNIIDACYRIYDEDGEYDYCKNGHRLFELKSFLYSNLPARLFNILCNNRKNVASDPCIQLSVLAHPRLTYLAADLETTIPHHFWLDLLPSLKYLVELSLKLICTDEILAVVGENCLLLEEINAVSRVDVMKSPFNAAVLTKNVSDVGLGYLMPLKRLRVLYIDPPRNERLRWRMGRCISQAGIRNLVSNLPSLEELRVESCDIGTTLVGGNTLHRLTLKKIDYHFASPDSVQKLLSMCPSLRDLSLTHMFGNQRDEVLKEVTRSDVCLHHLDLSFFEFSLSMSHLLYIKGAHITTFSFLEIDSSITFDGILTVGKCCPNINKLRLITNTNNLQVPYSYRLGKPHNMFNDLKTLILGVNNIDIKDILLFFITSARTLLKLDLKNQSVVDLDNLFVKLINDGMLNHIETISLDSTLILSKDAIKFVIDKCQNLTSFVVNCLKNDKSIQQHIKESNYDIVLMSTYC